MLRTATAFLVLAVLSACAARGYDRGPVTPKPLGKYEEPEITDEGVLAALTRTPAPPARNRIVVFFDRGSRQDDRRYMQLREADDIDYFCSNKFLFQDIPENLCRTYGRLKVFGFAESVYAPRTDQVYPWNEPAPQPETYYQSLTARLREIGRSQNANLVIQYTTYMRTYTQQTWLSITRLGLLAAMFFPVDEIRTDLTVELTVWDIPSDALIYAASETVSRKTEVLPIDNDRYGAASLYRKTVNRLTEKSLPGIAQALATGKPRSEYFSSRR